MANAKPDVSHPDMFGHESSAYPDAKKKKRPPRKKRSRREAFLRWLEAMEFDEDEAEENDNPEENQFSLFPEHKAEALSEEEDEQEQDIILSPEEAKRLKAKLLGTALRSILKENVGEKTLDIICHWIFAPLVEPLTDVKPLSFQALCQLRVFNEQNEEFRETGLDPAAMQRLIYYQLKKHRKGYTPQLESMQWFFTHNENFGSRPPMSDIHEAFRAPFAEGNLPPETI